MMSIGGENLRKENFTKILHRNSPEEILEYVKRHGKKPKSVCPIVFYPEDTNDGKDKK